MKNMEETEAKSKLVDFVILDKKLTVAGALHGLIGHGGELVLKKNFGIRLVPSGKWIEVQIIAYSETPTFKMSYATKTKKVIEKVIETVQIKAKDIGDSSPMKITGETNIFDEVD